MKNSCLLPAFLSCKIPLVDLNNRQRWWIKQPLAVSKSGKLTSLNYISISSSLMGFTVFGGMGREPKKTPPLRFPDLALFCGYPIHPTLSKVGKTLMSYIGLTTLNPFSAIRFNLCGDTI
jgi:hypothetical protein